MGYAFQRGILAMYKKNTFNEKNILKLFSLEIMKFSKYR